MSTDFKLGKTIVGARGRSREVELRRLAERKKARRRSVLTGGLILIVVGVVGVWLTLTIMEMVKQPEVEEQAVEMVQPKAEIVVEGGGQASVRMREFVANLEQDLSELGFTVARAVLPSGYMRRVDIYIEGRQEYFKMSVDRGSAVQAEDAERMMRYLDGKKLKVAYVDLRVEGKAYYK